MTNPKRASMREGPLAALFRKTTEDAPPPEREPEVDSPERERPHPSLQPLLPLEPSEPPVRRQPGEPEPGALTPQERLRSAFSSDIPESLLEPPAREPAVRTPQDLQSLSDWNESSLGVERALGSPVLRVVGIGGAGVNAVDRMIEAGIDGVDFIAINTDMQSLQQSAAPVTLHIGEELTRGRGSGSGSSRVLAGSTTIR